MPYDDLRKGRLSKTGQVYFITTVTDNRQTFFHCFQTARLVVLEMRRVESENRIRSLAWVLMPDHLHWLFVLQDNIRLSDTMKAFKARSALGVNRFLTRTGAVWQRAYYDHALRKEEDIKGIARYMIANPLRAGLVTNIGDYPLWDAVWL